MGRPPLILALDIATAVGWACGRAGEPPDYGTLRLPSAGGNGAISCALVDALADLQAVTRFEEVAVEAPVIQMAGRSPHTARRLVGLVNAAEMFCERRAIRCFEAASSTVRAKVLGSARFGGRDAAKAAVMAWARGMGWDPADDNAADALCLLAFRHGEHRLPVLKARAA